MPTVGMLYAPACSANCNVPDVFVTIAKALVTLKRLVRSAPVGVSKLPIAFTPLVYASVAPNTPCSVTAGAVVGEGEGDGWGAASSQKAALAQRSVLKSAAPAAVRIRIASYLSAASIARFSCKTLTRGSRP